jgi:hypothetical protein
VIDAQNSHVLPSDRRSPATWRRAPVSGHHDPVCGEEHIAARSAEKPVPPGQQADPGDGQIGRTTTIFECIGARGPLRAHELHGANLSCNRIGRVNLHDAKESNCKRSINGHDDASALNGYLISRHARTSNREP